jgi:hypothetical protein
MFSNCEGRGENFWGISCEKSRFYAKKSYLFLIMGIRGLWHYKSCHRESRVNGPHSLLLTSQQVINCFILTLFPLFCKLNGEPSNTNFKVYYFLLLISKTELIVYYEHNQCVLFLNSTLDTWQRVTIPSDRNYTGADPGFQVTIKYQF